MNQAVDQARPLPVGSKGHKAGGWWGMVTLVATEAAVFAYLLFSYYYLWAHSQRHWPIVAQPKFTLAIPGTIILVFGSFVMAWAEKGAAKGERWRLVSGTAFSIILALIFLALQVYEWLHKPFSFNDGLYPSLYYIITGFHMAHVAVGMLILAVVLFWGCIKYYTPQRHSTVVIAALYWHFVTVVWLFIFFTFYIVPYIGYP